MGIDDHLHSSSQLVLFGLPRPSVDTQVDSIMQPGVFNPSVLWVYVIVWMPVYSSVHELSRKRHCSIFDLLFRGDRQVPDGSSQYTLQYLMSVRTPQQFSSILPQARISLLSSSKCIAVLCFHTTSSLDKAK
jgi:hypothetical protein